MARKTSPLLLEDYPLIVLPKLAVLLGSSDAAIVLQQIQYWLNENEKHGRNFYDGRYWTYNSIAEWREGNFPWLSESTIKRIMKKLRSLGVVIVGNYNKVGFDKTNWYSIDYDALNQFIASGQTDTTIGSIWHDEEASLTLPIPETTTETTSESNNKSISGKLTTDKQSKEVRLLYGLATQLGIDLDNDEINRLASLLPKITEQHGKEAPAVIKEYLETWKSPHHSHTDKG